jgi:hypothetical protein
LYSKSSDALCLALLNKCLHKELKTESERLIMNKIIKIKQFIIKKFDKSIKYYKELRGVLIKK